MQTIGAFDAKTHFSQIIEQVLTGEEFTVTKHGKPVARIVPIAAVADETMAQHRLQVARSLKASRIRLKSGDTMRQFIDEGRKY
jgi:prevent-host-death family protein